MKGLLFEVMLKRQEKLNEFNNKQKDNITILDKKLLILIGQSLQMQIDKETITIKKNKEQLAKKLIEILEIELSKLLIANKNIEDTEKIDNFFLKKEVKKNFLIALELEEEKLNEFKFIEENEFVNNIVLEYDLKDHFICMSRYAKNIIEEFYILGLIFKYIGMDFDEIYKTYIAKHTLNYFRYKKGFIEENKYSKIWKFYSVRERDYVETRISDEEYVEQLKKSLPADENFEKKLLTKLKEKYKAFISNYY